MTSITDLDPAVKQKLWAEQRLLEANRRRDCWEARAALTPWLIVRGCAPLFLVGLILLAAGWVLLEAKVMGPGPAAVVMLLGAFVAVVSVISGFIARAEHRAASDELAALDDAIEQLHDKLDDALQKIATNEEAKRARAAAVARVRGRLEGLAREADWPDDDIAALSSLLDPSQAAR